MYMLSGFILYSILKKINCVIVFINDVCVPTHATAHLWRLSDNFVVESVLFFLYGPWESNSGLQDWKVSAFSHWPSCQSSHSLLPLMGSHGQSHVLDTVFINDSPHPLTSGASSGTY